LSFLETKSFKETFSLISNSIFFDVEYSLVFKSITSKTFFPSFLLILRNPPLPFLPVYPFLIRCVISGISFLPFSEHTYRQAPYQDCTKEEYNELLVKIPKKVDWSKLSNYEQQDYTVASQELACSAESGCEIVDL